MAEKYNVIYMGYSYDMLKCLINSQLFNVIKVIGVKGKMDTRQYSIISDMNMPYKELLCKNELNVIEDFMNELYIIIMYKFEYILPQNIIDKYLIFNFHGGYLKSNRGPHAVVRSILNMDRDTCLSLYKLTGGIDVGELIAEYKVNIDEEDSVNTLNTKLSKGIPFLLEQLYHYLLGELKGEMVITGKYYSKIQESDYTVDLMKDSIKQIKAKVRSQLSYNGAVCYIKNKKYGIRNYVYQTENYSCSRELKVESNRIILQVKDEKLVLNVEVINSFNKKSLQN